MEWPTSEEEMLAAAEIIKVMERPPSKRPKRPTVDNKDLSLSKLRSDTKLARDSRFWWVCGNIQLLRSKMSKLKVTSNIPATLVLAEDFRERFQSNKPEEETFAICEHRLIKEEDLE